MRGTATCCGSSAGPASGSPSSILWRSRCFASDRTGRGRSRSSSGDCDARNAVAGMSAQGQVLAPDKGLADPSEPNGPCHARRAAKKGAGSDPLLQFVSDSPLLAVLRDEQREQMLGQRAGTLFAGDHKPVLPPIGLCQHPGVESVAMIGLRKAK